MQFGGRVSGNAGGGGDGGSDGGDGCWGLEHTDCSLPPFMSGTGTASMVHARLPPNPL